MDFDAAIEIVLKHEGGLTRDSRDPGGLTNFGISQRAYPQRNIAELTREDAKAIYRQDYWQAVRADQLPPDLRLHLFDAAVNAGVRQAIQWLQRACAVKVDGIMGPETLRAAASTSGVKERMIAERLEFYTGLSNFSVFGRGWIRRVAQNIRLSATS
jgi:lysozyme family protein